MSPTVPPSDSIMTTGASRREFIRQTSTLALAACAVAASGTGMAAGARVAPAPSLSASVLSWDGARYLSDLSQLRAGWAPPCASLTGLLCPSGLPTSLSLVPRPRGGDARPMRLKMLGYDGNSGIDAVRLDALYEFPSKTGFIPYAWADVRNDREVSAQSQLRTWSVNGRVALQVSRKGMAAGTELPLSVPGTPGVYLVTVGQTSALDIAGLRFAEQQAGGLHRRLVGLDGAPLRNLGYFVVVLENA